MIYTGLEPALEHSPNGKALKSYRGGQWLVRSTQAGYQLLDFPDSQRNQPASNRSAPFFNDLAELQAAGRKKDADFDESVWVAD